MALVQISHRAAQPTPLLHVRIVPKACLLKIDSILVKCLCIQIN